LDLEYIYGSDTGKEGFEKANRNFSTVNAGLTTSEVNTKAYADTVSATAKTEAISETESWTQQNFSNPNLLINADFRNPINQREESSYSADGYTIDRWKLTLNGDSAATVTVNDGYITLTKSTTSTTSTAAPYFSQYIENYELLLGETVTISIELLDGSVYTKTWNIPDITTGYVDTNELLIGDTNWKVDMYGNIDSKYLTIRIWCSSAATGTANITKVKLELGSIATPFVPRSYGEELALCQRYYLQYNNTEFPMSYLVTGNTANVVFLVINVPVSMRTVPTIGGNYSFDVRGEGATATLTYSDFTGITRIGSNTFELHFTYTGTSEIFTNNTSNFAVINKGGTLTIDGEI
jgi:hypothetical protein